MKPQSRLWYHPKASGDHVKVCTRSGPGSMSMLVGWVDLMGSLPLSGAGVWKGSSLCSRDERVPSRLGALWLSWLARRVRRVLSGSSGSQLSSYMLSARLTCHFTHFDLPRRLLAGSP